MRQRRVVMADRDSSGLVRLTETSNSGGTIFEQAGLRIHHESIAPAETLSAPAGEWQHQVVVIAGSITAPQATGLEPLNSGDVLIAPGHVAVHAVDGPAEVLVAAIAVQAPEERSTPAPVASLNLAGARDAGVRRVVLAGEGDHVQVLQDGTPPRRIQHRAAITAYQVWQTGGLLHSVHDGGDVTGPYLNTPSAGGVMLQSVGLDPNGHDPGDHNWHATPTIDIDLVVAGELELAVPGHATVLYPGDIAVQYATQHAWTPRGTQPTRLLAFMIDAPGLGDAS